MKQITQFFLEGENSTLKTKTKENLQICKEEKTFCSKLYLKERKRHCNTLIIKNVTDHGK